MKGQNVAKAYARAILDLGREAEVDVARELSDFDSIISQCNDLENVIFLDIFTYEEKRDILQKILEKTSLSKLVTNFVLFLVQEKRISLFPFIFKEAMVIDDHQKGFLRVSVEGVGEDFPAEHRQKVKEYLAQKLGLNARLAYQRNDDLTAGYRISAENLQLDATVDYQFEMLKNSILGEG